MSVLQSPTSSPPESGAIDSRRLQVFLAAAQTSSFVAAADRLNLTPSAVSHAIKTLEEEFDCNLFKRHGPRVTLTRAGMRLTPLAEEVLNRMASLRKEVAVVQGNPRKLRVLMPETFSVTMLPRVLPDFMECFPMAIFEPVLGDSEDERAVQQLMSGELDLLLTWQARSSPDVVRRDLVQDTLGLYVAGFHALARKPQVDAAIFEQQPLLTSCATSVRCFLERKLTPGQRQNARVWHLPGIEAVRELARVGQGIALLSERAASRLVSAGQLIQLELPGPRAQMTCAAHWSGQTELSWAAEVFLSLVEMVAQE
ncbi:LysR family transcriptional regulator [Verrucomicrobium sp. BvORR106]|uniref:LysR family transcriptional regulator n=1 Tax=Verrucomicrobium sp. BvORR106 TaxID=1403819 RepID=UPI00057071EA|nr:LysR family transcriptional regulator [Verrucomicrobium sp. BvORR106]